MNEEEEMQEDYLFYKDLISINYFIPYSLSDP